MIVDGLLIIITGLVNFAYGLLPAWDFSPNYVDTLGGPSGANILDHQQTITQSLSPFHMVLVWMSKFNSFLPFDQLVLVLTFLGGFYAVLLVWKAVMRLVGWVRGAGTS